jgi:hypothetical protein
MNTDERTHIERLIQRWVQTDELPLGRESLLSKIDILERVLEDLRFCNRDPENKLRLENYVQGQVLADNGVMHFAPPQKPTDQGSGTRPILLQPNLLLFLLLNHCEAFEVYDIIAKFIEKMRPEFTLLDFKKTRTGVTRCFTNTRFAANVLRHYGFLKFTQKEAFKTWVLSLPGFVVAATVLEYGNWGLRQTEPKYLWDLHPDIWKASAGIDRYDEFVKRLESICQPNVEVFETFEEFLQKAHRLLKTYWQVIHDPNRTQTERREEGFRRIAEIERDPKIEQFYEEFSQCLNIEALLKQVK